ncbi:MAG: hypothetical protein JNL41_08925 [Phenylobacterium sp.]|uniref:hypothetical protein n=1 Tax=Phenylobacterium sp. TaxID=1871053 RepID=UPI001A4BF0C3|nr:hypothetical protein [Phenylobacterium sp.]MBL8554387.1 hypothetical protein [Phenylobacterium sp.]
MSSPEQLRWAVAPRAIPGAPGEAAVGVVVSNALSPELAFSMNVDWHAGAEAPDVEGRALVILSLLFRELAAECERAAGARFSAG